MGGALFQVQDGERRLLEYFSQAFNFNSAETLDSGEGGYGNCGRVA